MENTIRTYDAVLSMVGITIYSKTRSESKLWHLYQAFNFFQAFLTLIFTTGFVLVSYSDIIAWVEGACIWATAVITFISLGICMVFQKKFHEFMDEMIFCDGMLEMPFLEYVLKSEVSEKAGELKELVVSSQEKLLKYTRILLKTYVGTTSVCFILYLSGTIHEIITTEDKSLRLLAFQMWFPWSLEDFRVYIASFILNAYAGYPSTIAHAGFQLTIILLVGQTIRHLRIISFILLNLDDLVMELVGERGKRWQSCCTILLSQCMDHYTKIKRFSNRLNIICRPFYLTYIIVSILSVCAISARIAVSPKLTIDTLKYCIHGFYFIQMVLLFCYVGEQVQNECEQLEENVLEKWYIFNKSHKVNVQIFKTALDQRMPIYIFGSITLSLPTFTWFIKTVMSFFTLVMSALEEQN